MKSEICAAVPTLIFDQSALSNNIELSVLKINGNIEKKKSETEVKIRNYLQHNLTLLLPSPSANIEIDEPLIPYDVVLLVFADHSHYWTTHKLDN